MPDPVHYDFDPVEITGDQPTSVGAESSTPTEDKSPIHGEKPIYRSNKVFEIVVHGERERTITEQALRESVTEPHDIAVDNVLQQFVTIPHDEAVGYYVLASPPATRTAPPYDAGTPAAERTGPTAAPPAADERTADKIVDGAISVLGRSGLPVNFLQEIRRSNYRFVQVDALSHRQQALTSRSVWSSSRGEVRLLKDTVEDLKSISTAKMNFLLYADAIDTLYHESLHVYFNLHSSNTMISGLRTLSRLDYNGSPLTNQQGQQIGIADNPDRIFSEAGAEYVAHRVRTWWNTFAFLTTMAEDKEVALEVLEETLMHVEISYNEEMTKRVFGYQDVGFFSPEGARTTVSIRPELKRFLDTTILEGRIPEKFAEVRTFRELAAKVRRRIPRHAR